MPEHAYHISAREAQIILKIAIDEAKALLPPAVTKQHWIVGSHSSSAWRSVEQWYREQDALDMDVLATLTDLALMSEALACLVSVTAAGSS